ncbi:MAG: DUF2800 domain-containing protein [Rhizorhabdus sp.]|uniref:DUF2800 domain-containing protein n=1 Tax=Rhizorhabdus sp. TaxID=1968843 RepID=UPI001B738F42|nr:DUF2800 domain-containing protein [Rhizorhabdus sp.]MBP8231764.1 DUF2800 domain-containing protein [Rhizorhabdus sp.]
MAGQHATLSPSSAHRRILCPGSLAASKGAPNESSIYAAEGTAYHDIAARALCYHKSCLDYVGRTFTADGYEFTITDEDAGHAQTYVDAIRRLPGIQHYEMRLDTSPVVGVPGQGGTGDAVTLDLDHATVHVDDLKFGRGEIVNAQGNAQLLEYGAAALMMFAEVAEWKYLRVAIHQPRVNHYSEWIYPIEEVLQWVRENQPIEQQAYRLWESGSPDEIRAAMAPSEKACRWCPIKGTCAARAEYMMAQFPIDHPTTILEMSDAQLADARNKVADMQDWCSAVEAEALRRALAGVELPGWKLVDGKKGARKWTDAQHAEARLLAALKDAAYKPREIITPTEAEKRMKKAKALAAWEEIQCIIEQADGKKSLAPADDPRVAIAVTPVEFGLDESGAI